MPETPTADTPITGLQQQADQLADFLARHRRLFVLAPTTC
jgi:hypothetical protein